MTETDIDDMTTEELYEAAVEAAPDEQPEQPVHDDVDDCPRCGSDQTGMMGLDSRSAFGCNECLYRWG